MPYLIFGLVIFLVAHSVRIAADDWRTRVLARLGELQWKGLFSVVSVLGLGLIIWGFGETRMHPVQLWQPPTAMRHLAALLTLGSFVLLAAAYVPGNSIKARVHHPMVLGVKVWALAHLLANGNLAHVLLFGSFLLWSIFDFAAAQRRDRASACSYPPGRAGATVVAILAGLAVWLAFAFWLHGMLIGVRPMG